MALISGRRKTISSEAKKGLAIEGIDEIQANLARVLNATTGKAMKQVMMRAALVARNRIRDLAPLGKTGNLKRGVFAAYGDDNLPNVLVGMNYKIAPHAHLVEFGHAGKAAGPHPYFRPGITQAAPIMKPILEEGFKKVIEDAPK
jgi:hypothetical protein